MARASSRNESNRDERGWMKFSSLEMGEVEEVVGRACLTKFPSVPCTGRISISLLALAVNLTDTSRPIEIKMMRKKITKRKS